MTWIIILVLYALLVLATIVHIILFGSRPTKSLTWLLLVIVFPIGGILLYVVFGINRRRLKFFRLKLRTRRRLYDTKYRSADEAVKLKIFDDVKLNKIASLLANSGHYTPKAGNKVVVLDSGKVAFNSLFEAMRSATKFIHIQYYIFEEGELMDSIIEILTERIKDGVEVRILYDAIGSISLSDDTKNKFKEIGAKMFAVMPLKLGSFLYTINYRNHRKIVVVDGQIGFTGGINVSDKYIKQQKDQEVWDDTHLRIEGPAVDSLNRIFIKDFFFASDEELLLNDSYLPKIKEQGDSMVQIVQGGPDSPNPTIMQQYIGMINMAEEYIYISNPYFIPNVAMVEALRMAALTGVQISLLVPMTNDSWLAKHSMLSYFEEMLSLGICIFQQRDEFLHSKVIIVDGKIVSIGSGNFDHRSFEHNFEANALIYDEKVALAMCKDFNKDTKKAKELTYESYKKRPWKQKAAEGFARFFSPML